MHDFLKPAFDVAITRDVAFSVGGVGLGSPAGLRYRELRLDVYEPAGDSSAARPALILAFGGAFHRGSKETDEFGDGEGMSTPMAEYARLFAARGYVCFCIDYRLTQEQPHPGFTPTLAPNEPMNKDRVNVVRGMLGLPPATDAELANGIEAATDDMTAAVNFVRARAHFYRVDIARIALGGFSAGAVIALSSAFVERAQAAAVVSLSGRFNEANLRRCVTGAPDEPAVLMFVGERDLPVMLEAAAPTQAHFASVRARGEVILLAGATHFYPKTTRTPAGDDIETTIARFLKDTLKLHQV